MAIGWRAEKRMRLLQSLRAVPSQALGVMIRAPAAVARNLRNVVYTDRYFKPETGEAR